MLLFSLIFSVTLASEIPRIETRIQDLGNTSRVYLKFGMISVVEFPYNIIEVRVGNPNVLKAVISSTSPRELTLYYKSATTAATNLIAKSDKKIYVIDVIPSKNTHQDLVKITSGVGNYNSSKSLRLIKEVEITPSARSNDGNNQILLEKVKL